MVGRLSFEALSVFLTGIDLLSQRLRDSRKIQPGFPPALSSLFAEPPVTSKL